MTGRHTELMARILHGEADANIGFDELRALLRFLGFAENVRGSHHILRHPILRERINLQRDGSKAKVYQVRQVRRILEDHDFGGGIE